MTEQETSAVGREAVSTRERIVRATARLVQQQGYAATGLKQIATEADARLGSVYHFFPGGKQELAAVAIGYNADQFTQSLRDALDAHPDVGDAITGCAADFVAALRETDWIDSRAFTAIAIEPAGRLPEIQQVLADAVETWRQLVAAKLRSCGVTEADADELGETVISTLQGATLACQIRRSGTPLLMAGKHLARLISTYL